MRTVRVPGDKSISHRALMLAPLADGTSRLSGLGTGDDVLATERAMRALGANLRAREPGSYEVLGPTTLRSPVDAIDCGNSGTTARLLLGLLAGREVSATLDGDASLRARPMDRIIAPLRQAGARVRELGEPGRLPVQVTGTRLSPIEHSLSVASAQVKSALLLAALGSAVAADLSEPGPSRDHTERILRTMGVPVDQTASGARRRVRLAAVRDALRPLALAVPGDFSSAAFWLALAVLGGAGNGVRLERVGLNPTRTGFLRALRRMGAGISVAQTAEVAGEPVGTLLAEPAGLRGIVLPPGWMPTLLDEVPLVACLATRAAGTTTITGAEELRVKESDRLAVLRQNLESLSVGCRELADGLVIEGTRAPLVGRVTSAGDHRIAMAFGVLGALPGNRIEIDGRESAGVSYPGFWQELAGVANEEISP